MNLEIYQAFYQAEQVPFLEPDFIPYDNTEDDKVLLEYAMWKKVHKKKKGTDRYWGILSWRWREKTGLYGLFFKEWILANPGYDVYHFDPYISLLHFKNLWMHGDKCHPGMAEYINKLLPKLGYNFNIEDLEYTSNNFGTCHYFIGNDTFWKSYLKFLDTVIEITKLDPELNKYMFETESTYRERGQVNFPFVVERLFSLFCILNPKIKVKKYPYESFCFKDRLGSEYAQHLCQSYNLQKRDAEIQEHQKTLLTQ